MGVGENGQFGRVGEASASDEFLLVSSGGNRTRVGDGVWSSTGASGELPPEFMAEHAAVRLRPGDIVAGRFQVVRLLGFGGMGAVYHVKDGNMHGEDKALKLMLPSLLKSKQAQERFLAEVRISQNLRHDGIVTVYDLNEDRQRGFCFFTMEFVPGVTLHRYLKDNGGRLDVGEALDIVRQLCTALEYAHQYTVHRDLKPQNVMVRPDGRIKVLDFGLAKVMTPGRMTKSSMALGTAYYQAPEQSIQLDEVGPRADIYSLGVMMYEMLTGVIPTGMAEPPSKEVRGIRKQLDAVVARCLRRKPEERHASAAQLQTAIDEAMANPVGQWWKTLSMEELLPYVGKAAIGVVCVAVGIPVMLYLLQMFSATPAPSNAADASQKPHVTKESSDSTTSRVSEVRSETPEASKSSGVSQHRASTKEVTPSGSLVTPAAVQTVMPTSTTQGNDVTAEAYARNPRTCAFCNAVLPYDMRTHLFCSTRCELSMPQKTQYETNPKICLYCKNPIPFENRESDLCSVTCEEGYSQLTRVNEQQSSAGLSGGGSSLSEQRRANRELGGSKTLTSSDVTNGGLVFDGGGVKWAAP